eukprot:10053919-Alexandrium_andersonii.AAC.1
MVGRRLRKPLQGSERRGGGRCAQHRLKPTHPLRGEACQDLCWSCVVAPQDDAQGSCTCCGDNRTGAPGLRERWSARDHLEDLDHC